MPVSLRTALGVGPVSVILAIDGEEYVEVTRNNRTSLVTVNTNPLYTAPEMEHQFADSGATGLVVIDLFADKVAQVLPKTAITTVIVVTIADLLPWLTRHVVRAVRTRKMITTSVSIDSMNQPLRNSSMLARAT